MLKIFLEMNERAGRLDQAFEKIGITRSCFQPKLLEDIVRFIVALFIPAMKERTIKWVLRDRPAPFIHIPAFHVAHQMRNPLAFAHDGLSLIAAQTMSKPRRLTFPEHRHVACAASARQTRSKSISGQNVRWAHRLKVYVLPEDSAESFRRNKE